MGDSKSASAIGPVNVHRCEVCALPPDGSVFVVVFSNKFATRIIIGENFFSENADREGVLMGRLVRESIVQNKKANDWLACNCSGRNTLMRRGRSETKEGDRTDDGGRIYPNGDADEF